MAKRRKGNHEEVMLIPFLDILCSLIGILVLIIVVLCVANTRQTQGRTPDEVARAGKFASLTKELKSLDKQIKDLESMKSKLESQQAEADKKQTRLTELRKRLNISGDEATSNKVEAAKIQKQVEDLVLQIQSLVSQMPPIQKEIAALKQQLALLKKKPDNKPLPVIIKPSGSGMSGQRKLFFVEASNGAITLRKGRTEKQNIGLANLAADKNYNDFLAKIKSTPNSMLVFLIRQDGGSSYNVAAGLAQSNYEILTGKLPIPEAGEIDLGLFEK